MRSYWAALFFFVSAISAGATPGFAKEASYSGLPVPRFVSLKSDEVNVRTGPGTRYPISWVYHRKAWPVEVVEEFELWRKIRDVEGTQGWVHKNMLDGKRTILIAKKTRTLLRSPEEGSPIVVKAQPNVVGLLIECQKAWCRVQIESRKGWLKKSEFWGAYPKEEF